MKNKKLSICISDADWQRFHEKAEQADITLTEYITDCCLGKQIVVIDGLDEVIRQQKAIGRNLNQLTTLANMGRVKTVYLQLCPLHPCSWNMKRCIFPRTSMSGKKPCLQKSIWNCSIPLTSWIL